MSEQTQDEQLRNIVNAAPTTKGKIARWLGLAVLLAAVAGGWIMWSASQNRNGVSYVTEEAARGKLTVTVSATGNLQPTNQVDVGSELSGTVEKVLVDDNDHVKRGQILAQLDLSKLNDQVAKSQAAVVAAEAQVAQTRATVAETTASLARLKKVAELSGGKVPSKTEMDSAEAALLRAVANEANAKAAVAQARATLKSDLTNVSKATTRSPIDGVVLVRKVEPGQTVAASLQAPVMFTLAEDLTQMELQVDVDEADVGQVKIGQPAKFTVDAWPGRKYPAEITRVGFGSQVKDGVVSYKTILKLNNDDLSLRPGMTATAEIQTAVREDVLLIPNAALRFSPDEAKPQKKSGGLVSAMLPRPPSAPKQKKNGKNGAGPKVWVLRDGKPVAIPIKTGLTDGKHTEVLAGELQAGMPVITETQKAQQ